MPARHNHDAVRFALKTVMREDSLLSHHAAEIQQTKFGGDFDDISRILHWPCDVVIHSQVSFERPLCLLTIGTRNNANDENPE